MASSNKAELARAGTMEVTSKEGKAYLEKNLTEWKKPLLIDQTADDVGDSSGASSGKKGQRGGKKVAAKEPEEIDDEDEEEQGEEEEEEEEEEEDDDVPMTKKARFAKASTMQVTAKEGKELIGNKKLGDTRQVTKAKQKAAPKRAGTMAAAVAEAKAVYGDLDSTASRSMRKRSAVVSTPAKKSKLSTPAKKTKPAAKKPVIKKAALKPARTMAATAKEGAALIGSEDLGDTRQVTKAIKKAKAVPAKPTKKAAKKKSK